MTGPTQATEGHADLFDTVNAMDLWHWEPDDPHTKQLPIFHPGWWVTP